MKHTGHSSDDDSLKVSSKPTEPDNSLIHSSAYNNNAGNIIRSIIFKLSENNHINIKIIYNQYFSKLSWKWMKYLISKCTT